MNIQIAKTAAIKLLKTTDRPACNLSGYSVELNSRKSIKKYLQAVGVSGAVNATYVLLGREGS
jgi:hypothetical protein